MDTDPNQRTKWRHALENICRALSGDTSPQCNYEKDALEGLAALGMYDISLLSLARQHDGTWASFLVQLANLAPDLPWYHNLQSLSPFAGKLIMCIQEHGPNRVSPTEKGPLIDLAQQIIHSVKDEDMPNSTSQHLLLVAVPIDVAKAQIIKVIKHNDR